MSAQLLYKMIKSKTEFPLHKAIKVEREDVVFLYLIEMDSQVLSLHQSSLNSQIRYVAGHSQTLLQDRLGLIAVAVRVLVTLFNSYWLDFV